MKSRSESLVNARRIVIKVGSALLTQSSINLFESLAAQISALQSQGYHVIVVSSGAIAVARKSLGLHERPKKLATLQALAALGQPQLMSAWAKAFGNHDLHVAQVLLTHADLEARERFNNARQSIDALLKMGIIPIINENDSVATEEIQVGDNDNLAAHIAALVHADLLILLTDVEAVYDSPPGENPNAQPILEVSDTKKIRGSVSRIGQSGMGVGGMYTKVEAAERATSRGISVVIGHGQQNDILSEICQGKEVGTWFRPQIDTLNSRKHWIAYTLKSHGSITVDPGAERALKEHGKSLLPKGISKVNGHFQARDMVDIQGPDGIFARGLVRYDSDALSRIQGEELSAISGILGIEQVPVVIHRDDFVLLDNIDQGAEHDT